MEKRQGSLYPVLDTLMDDFFRECSKAGAIPFFDDVYVKVDENIAVGRELVERLAKYTRTVRSSRGNRLPSFEPFVIAGPTGAGKSALLLRLETTKQLITRFSPLSSTLIVVHLDCLNYVSFSQILREMIQRLVEQCKKSGRVWDIIRTAGWERKLKRSVVSSLAEDEARSLFEGVLRTLYNRPAGGAKRVVPVCFILDNLDRVPGFELKCNSVLFAARQAKAGYPFFILTLRHGTKKDIDDCAGETAAIPTHDIHTPKHTDVLGSRLEVAFSDKVLRHAESWARRIEVNGVLGRLRLTFRDLRESIRSAMGTLISSTSESGEGFVSSLAGNNMRNALTLFRAIIKSIDDKELLILCLGEARQHSLIRFAMLERYPIYLERHSKIRNMFSQQSTDFYFAKLYVLQSLRDLQRGPEGDNYVSFDEWRRRAVSHGIPETVFRKEAWDLMAGNLALIEVENTDGSLPDDLIRNIEDLPNGIGVKVTPAGNYYLSWLIYDTSYLRCVLQDTLMDVGLAKKLAAPQRSVRTALDQVKEFVDYLTKREDEERIAWRLHDSVTKFGPRLVDRVARQESALLSAGRDKDTVDDG